jgi:2-phosphosulfolactate phosphatase
MSQPSIEIRRATLDTCHEATGAVVVVDVLRAFTTAAYAFDRGAVEICLVSTVAEAFELRDRLPGCLLLGEVNGRPIEGFDLSNSPAATADLDLEGRRLIQRTTAGTQGVVRSTRADPLFVASLSVASATASAVARSAKGTVTFVETGVGHTGGGDEDVACADYIAGLLLGAPPSATEVAERVAGSGHASLFSHPEFPEFPAADLQCALEIDRFPFSMQVSREDGLLVLRAVG